MADDWVLCKDSGDLVIFRNGQLSFRTTFDDLLFFVLAVSSLALVERDGRDFFTSGNTQFVLNNDGTVELSAADHPAVAIIPLARIQEYVREMVVIGRTERKMLYGLGCKIAPTVMEAAIDAYLERLRKMGLSSGDALVLRK